MNTQVRDFNQKMDTTYKETLWKIKDVETIIESRISEQKVTNLLKDLESRLSSNLKIADERLSASLNSKTEELKSNIEFGQMDSKNKHEELKKEVKRFSMQIESTVKKDVFNMTVVKIDDLKRQIEGEMDDI